jgi:hypothetical protein
MADIDTETRNSVVGVEAIIEARRWRKRPSQLTFSQLQTSFVEEVS